jgi:glycosyltransferase involved in cell wall biosynthesis
MRQFPTWTDIETFLQAEGNAKERNIQHILYAGALIPRKGAHHLINAFALVARTFPHACLVIVGHAENKAYAVELQEQVRRLGLDGRVQFVGAIPQAELAVWMSRTYVFVLPTYSEGLPRVIFEAMAAGCLIISTPVSGIPEVVQDGITGFLLPPSDEAMLAERLRWALENPGLSYEMGHRAHAFAEQFFSTQSYVRAYTALFEEAHRKLQSL